MAGRTSHPHGGGFLQPDACHPGTIWNNWGLTHYFKAIVSGQQLSHSKPNPDIFLLAAEKLGTEPARRWCWRTATTASAPVPPGLCHRDGAANMTPAHQSHVRRLYTAECRDLYRGAGRVAEGKVLNKMFSLTPKENQKSACSVGKLCLLSARKDAPLGQRQGGVFQLPLPTSGPPPTPRCSNCDRRQAAETGQQLLGQRSARRECRPRHEADAGCRNPSPGYTPLTILKKRATPEKTKDSTPVRREIFNRFSGSADL